MKGRGESRGVRLYEGDNFWYGHGARDRTSESWKGFMELVKVASRVLLSALALQISGKRGCWDEG